MKGLANFAENDSSKVPEELTKRDQWVDHEGKRPLCRWSDPGNWRPFEEGRGFVLSDNDPLICVDIDGCRARNVDGDWMLSATALDIVRRIDSYTEISPSGEGLHVWAVGDIPRNVNQTVEFYCHDSFMTVTGDHLGDTPKTVNERHDEVEAVFEDYTETDIETGGTTKAATTDGGTTTFDVTPDVDDRFDLTDEKVIEKAKECDSRVPFEALWSGRWEGRYDSQSEADMALCGELAYFTQKDPQQIDRLFKQSGLMREKWTNTHYKDGHTYGEMTIRRAIRGKDDVYGVF